MRVADEDKLVKAGVEAALKPFADLLDKIAGPGLEELGLTLKDHVRVFRLGRQVRLLKRTKEILEEAGIEPKRVPLKLLGPIIESGSLEEDDILQDKWAALLANAAADVEKVHPGFPEVLKQLSANEVLYLRTLHFVIKDHKENARFEGVNYEPRNEKEDFREMVRVVAKQLKGLELSQVEMLLGKAVGNGNLERLGLMYRTVAREALTQYGEDFVDACEAPKSFHNACKKSSKE